MSYRDDLEAAQARADALARENEQLREEKATLEIRAAAERAALERKAAIAEAERRAATERAAISERAAGDREALANKPIVTLGSNGAHEPNALETIATTAPAKRHAWGEHPGYAIALLGFVLGALGILASIGALAAIGFGILAFGALFARDGS